jgi:transcriptional regulator GlxA family with amidase domain/YHS domain-containing protein
MNRRDWLQMSAALGVGASLSHGVMGATGANGREGAATQREPTAGAPLHAPAGGSIPVAFLISADAVLIDFVGPWEVFLSVKLPGPNPYPFQTYTVAESLAPVRVGGGLTIMPSFTFATAPPPKVIVIPAQSPPTEALLAWVRKAAPTADLTMSVCTGAFVLAKTGLLSGREATTHHSAYSDFAMSFPDIKLKRGARFVDLGSIASAGGLSSGIDLALHVVERYFGRDVAAAAADYMEYQGRGWTDPNSNNVYAQARRSTDEHPLCPVCGMDVDKLTAPRSTYRGKTYYFCLDEHKTLFDSAPGRFLSA